MELEAAEAGLDAPRFVEIVGVEDADVLAIAAAMAMARLRVLCAPAFGCVRIDDAGIGYGAGGIDGVITGAIVDDDDAIRRAGLRKEAAERVPDIALMIEEGDECGEHGGDC